MAQHGIRAKHNQLYLVEMKWFKNPVGVSELALHMVRLFSRADARGIFISAFGVHDAGHQRVHEPLEQQNNDPFVGEGICHAANERA